MAISKLPPLQRIALIDDDILFIRMVERVLFGERTDVVPITTLDPEEAVEIIATGDFSLALIDVMMYGHAAGFDLVERLRAHDATASMPIVITSGAQREIGRRVDFLQEHNCSVLLKPFEPEELVSRVRSFALPDQAKPISFPAAVPPNVRPFRPQGGAQPA
jgi:DNA-binding response OmpR family regulator